MIPYIRKRSRALDAQLILGILAINLSLFLIMTPQNHFMEMIQSLSLQILFALFAFVVLLAFRKRWLSAMISLVSIILLGGHLHPNVNFIADKSSSTSSNLSFAHFNVLKYNRDYDEIVELALESNADFLSFNEVTQAWDQQLNAHLSEQYPYKQSLALNGSFGISVYSKYPISESKVHWEGNYIPYLSGNILLNGQSIFYVDAHTIPPTNAASFKKRNAQINAISNLLNKHSGPEFLIGDLNAVGWSHAIRKLKENSNLYDSRKSIAGTYPSWSKYFKIPIDHILHSDDFYCNSFSTINNAGSDHLGILATFSFKKQSKIAQN